MPVLKAIGTNPSEATNAVTSTGRSRVIDPSITALRTLAPRLDAARFDCPLFALDPVVKPPFEEKPEVRKTGPLFKVG